MKHKILVVDDEPQMRELLCMYFTQKGYYATAAASSEEALKRVKEKPVDLVVLDIGLADEDGLEVLGTLKTADPKLRVIMLTGMGFVEDLLQEAQQKGADGYVSKVLPLDELTLTVQRVLKSQKDCAVATSH
jgi:two-component system, OmpR family, response regulator